MLLQAGEGETIARASDARCSEKGLSADYADSSFDRHRINHIGLDRIHLIISNRLRVLNLNAFSEQLITETQRTQRLQREIQTKTLPILL